MEELLSPLLDDVFKYIFADQRNTDNLAGLLRPIVNLPEAEYDRLTIVDPFLRRLFRKDKQGILDVKVLTKSGKIINVEVQICTHADLRKRILYYLSKLLWEQLRRGDDYGRIQQVIGVIICDHVIPEEAGETPDVLFPGRPAGEKTDPYINTYTFRSDFNGKRFTNLIKIITIELPKVPKEPDQSAAWPWARFFTCKREEEFTMLVEQYPEVTKVVGSLRKLSLSERWRMIAEEKEIRRKDLRAIEKYAREEARQKGLEEGRTKGLEEGRTAGLEEGRTAGLEEGRTAGLEEGRTAGLEEGRTKGLEEGRAEAYQEKLEAARKLKREGLSAERIAGILALDPEVTANL
ncbi:MAG: Rpn family recombination-promoting nuclease/putative transposase [Spirochaetaceae bacterium]|jgi:predicted transposase/invertase (TIGR01784 family)|nr:Rpn family recombination-promoting nuclease/putative transposase [Spirochaetaceae bacterium]